MSHTQYMGEIFDRRSTIRGSPVNKASNGIKYGKTDGVVQTGITVCFVQCPPSLFPFKCVCFNQKPYPHLSLFAVPVYLVLLFSILITGNQSSRSCEWIHLLTMRDQQWHAKDQTTYQKKWQEFNIWGQAEFTRSENNIECRCMLRAGK